MLTPMKKKLTLSLLALVIAGCVLISIGLVAGVYFLLKSQKNYTPPVTTPLFQPTLATVVPAQGTQNSTPLSGTQSPLTLTSDIAKQMDEIQLDVNSIRGLKMKTDLQRALMTPEKLKDTVVNEFFADYTPEDAKKDVKVLSTLGLLEPNFDLRQFYLDLYSEQIAGYYDSTTKEMYVIAGKDFGGLERITYAHEFTHVLQDQNYDMENGLKLNEEYCKNETEYCAAVTALVEGDATLTEQFWFLQYSTDLDKDQVSKFQQTYSSPVYDSAPAYMKKDFLFPYQEGFAFVNQLYGRKKWQAIDDAFMHPPTSTEQILHPEKYPKENPVLVEIPDLLPTLGSGWTEIDRNVMGEWYTYLILSSAVKPQYRMDDAEARVASTGWGGDTYVYYTSADSKDYLFTWHSNWDTSHDSDEFYSLSRNYGSTRWGIPLNESDTSVTWSSTTDGFITIRKAGNDVLWGMSTTEGTLKSVLPLIGGFGN
jgi:hypothetical protein